PGGYRVGFRIVRHHQMYHNSRGFQDSAPATPETLAASGSPVSGMSLHVEDRPRAAAGFAPLLQEIRTCLVEASRLQRLPDDYIDITEGWLASWKRWIKRKLLGNFKHAYVDVLSRQQSRFNQRVLTALTELADYCATLEHAAKTGAAVRDQGSGIRGQESGVRSQGSEVRSQTSEFRDQKYAVSASDSDFCSLTPDS